MNKIVWREVFFCEVEWHFLFSFQFFPPHINILIYVLFASTILIWITIHKELTLKTIYSCTLYVFLSNLFHAEKRTIKLVVVQSNTKAALLFFAIGWIYNCCHCLLWFFPCVLPWFCNNVTHDIRHACAKWNGIKTKLLKLWWMLLGFNGLDFYFFFCVHFIYGLNEETHYIETNET